MFAHCNALITLMVHWRHKFCKLFWKCDGYLDIVEFPWVNPTMMVACLQMHLLDQDWNQLDMLANRLYSFRSATCHRVLRPKPKGLWRSARVTQLDM